MPVEQKNEYTGSLFAILCEQSGLIKYKPLLNYH